MPTIDDILGPASATAGGQPSVNDILGPAPKDTTLAPKEDKKFSDKQLMDIERAKFAGELGFGAGGAKLFSGALENVPFLGEYAAKFSKELSKQGDPGAQKVGELSTALTIPLGMFGKAGAEGLPFLKRGWEGMKEGAKGGAVFGLMEPTYDEGTGRYITKLEQALGGGLLGSLIGGPLSAAFGRRPPSISVESVMEQAKSSGQSMFDAARKMANEKFGEGTKKAEQEFVSILQDAERRYGDLRRAQLRSEITTRRTAAAPENQPVAVDVNQSQSLTQSNLPAFQTGADVAANRHPSAELRALGNNALRMAETRQDIFGGPAFQAYERIAEGLQRTNPVGMSADGQRLQQFLEGQSEGGRGPLVSADVPVQNLARQALSRLFPEGRSARWQIWDEYLRELRDETSGKIAENFTPIQINRINSVANRIEETLQNWVGRENFPREIYAAASEDLNRFRTDLGRALTEREQIPFSSEGGMYEMPQTQVEATVFKTRDSVNYAKQLMGDANVDRIGQQYAVNQLRGKSAQDVRKWLDSGKNEFIDAIPGLRDRLNQYHANLLEREGRSSAMEALGRQFRGDIERSRATLDSEVNKVTDYLKQAAADRGTALTKAESDLNNTLETINQFNEAIRKLPAEKILERWPEARVKMEQTGLFNPQELDALGDQLSKAAQIAEQKAREAAATSALMNAVGVVAKKAGIPVGILGGLGAGGAAVYRAVKD